VNEPKTQNVASFFSLSAELLIMSGDLINANPVIYDTSLNAYREDERRTDVDEDAVDEFDALEIFELIRHINDPEVCIQGSMMNLF
jgi:hypothetical protein